MKGSSSSPPPESWALTRLEAERVVVRSHLQDLRRALEDMIEAAADSNADDEHDPEGSTIAFERSQLKALIHQAEVHLGDINDARAKMDGGRYGLCERCGQPISAARLDARPVARTCIGCATATRQDPHPAG